LSLATRPYRRTANGRRKPLTRYGAMKGALRERLAPEVLHHQLGHDPTDSGQALRDAMRCVAPQGEGRWKIQTLRFTLRSQAELGVSKGKG